MKLIQLRSHKDHYYHFLIRIQKKIDLYETRLNTLNQSKEKLYAILFELDLNKTLDTIELDRQTTSNTLHFNSSDTQTFKSLILKYIKLNNAIKRLENLLAEFKIYLDTDEKLFKRIYQSLCVKLSKSLLSGYTLNFSYPYISKLFLSVRKCFINPETGEKRKRIDWNKSKKEKQRLINEGFKVYKKGECEDGVKWFVYFEEEDNAYLRWTKSKNKDISANLYVCKPMNNFKRLVHEHFEKNPLEKLKLDNTDGI